MSVDAFARRLASLPELHKSPGRIRRELLAEAARCSVELAGTPCGQPAELLPCGWRCVDHRRTAPDPAASLPPAAPARPPRVYGTATTDPLGRDGDGWHINPQTMLPVRDRT